METQKANMEIARNIFSFRKYSSITSEKTTLCNFVSGFHAFFRYFVLKERNRQTEKNHTNKQEACQPVSLSEACRGLAIWHGIPDNTQINVDNGHKSATINLI